MKKRSTLLSLIIIFLFLLGAAGSVSADTSKLIGMLTSQLGVSDQQAEGGAGAIFDYAKKNLSPQDFTTVSDALPGVDSLIGSAPKTTSIPDTGGLTTKMGSSMPSMGGSAESAAGMAGLADSFSSLGLDNQMVDKYVDVILDYAKSEGGDTVMNLLKGGLF